MENGYLGFNRIQWDICGKHHSGIKKRARRPEGKNCVPLVKEISCEMWETTISGYVTRKSVSSICLIKIHWCRMFRFIYNGWVNVNRSCMCRLINRDLHSITLVLCLNWPTTDPGPFCRCYIYECIWSYIPNIFKTNPEHTWKPFLQMSNNE